MRKWTDTENTAWQEAKEKGQARFNGPVCRRCHKTERYTASRVCVACQSTRQRLAHAADPRKKMLAGARWRAKINGLPFNLVLDDLHVPAKCPVLGTAMEVPSIDRHNNDKGYVKGNVHVISFEANRLKNNLTLDQAKALVRYMEKCI